MTSTATAPGTPTLDHDDRLSLFELDSFAQPAQSGNAPPPEIVIAGRTLAPSRVFDTYWYFASARQEAYEARQERQSGPWTADPILQKHRFTNCYRAADRVSQYLIRSVAYSGSQDPGELAFRILLFKLFNRISTWELLESNLGPPSWKHYSFNRYNQILSSAFSKGNRLYSAAYVVPPPRLGELRKHANHLRLLELMMRDRIAERLTEAGSLRGAFQVLRSYPAIGDFLGYQFAIDLNYSSFLNYSESDYVVAGPGARDGIRKCFGPSADGIEAEIIRYMADNQDRHFERLGLRFSGLRGRPLQLIDCQNLFCEVDKYSRVAHPEIIGHSGRQRIKQLYKPVMGRVAPGWFPPKWGINQGTNET